MPANKALPLREFVSEVEQQIAEKPRARKLTVTRSSAAAVAEFVTGKLEAAANGGKKGSRMIGDKPMTATERVRRHRAKKKGGLK